MKTIAQKMADFAFALRYESIPREVRARARRHLADTLACALGAHGAAPIRALRSYVTGHSGSADATIIGTGEKVPTELAALINATMIRHHDANDIFVLRRRGASGHFSDGTAALLALAERHRRSGRELVTCLVASYELQGAVAEAIDFWPRGLHPLANVAWAVPIVAARLRGATLAEAVHACGLSAATSTVLNTWLRPSADMPMIKSVAAGLVGHHAVMAAELAAAGVTATEDALETILGGAKSQRGLRFDKTPFEKLGKRWTLERNWIKRHPAQVNTQAAIEAALRLREKNIRMARVRRLILYGHRHVCGCVQGSPQAFAPASREAADHSTPYVVAMALLRGRLTPREFEGAPWTTAPVRTAMSKIKLVIDPRLDRAFDKRGSFGVRLGAELEDGRTEEIIVPQPKGHPHAPLTDAELREKFSWLLGGARGGITPEGLLSQCLRLATVRDLRLLIASCRVRPEKFFRRGAAKRR